jgi:peptidoglycan hydrolase CwlO-like protein
MNREQQKAMFAKSQDVSQKDWYQASKDGVDSTSYKDYNQRIQFLLLFDEHKKKIEHIQWKVDMSKKDIDGLNNDLKNHIEFAKKHTFPYTNYTSRSHNKQKTEEYHYDKEGTDKAIKALKQAIAHQKRKIKKFNETIDHHNNGIVAENKWINILKKRDQFKTTPYQEQALEREKQ